MALTEQVQKLKALLGISDTAKDVLIEFTIDKVSEMICNYCNVSEVPQGLYNTMYSMCIDMYRSDQLGQEQAEGSVKGITEGDVSVSFGSASAVSDNPGMAFLKNYTGQLNRYRKAGW
ncbi:MAG: phage head-tail connector protein [Clostridia bacterium]|jgi:hypothetical protein|nr:phage head-tail connector protein [Clostridia bacterium]